MEKIRYEYSDGTKFILDGEWLPDTFSKLSKGGIVVKINGEHPSTFCMTYEEVIFEMSRTGSTKEQIDKKIAELKLIREVSFKN